MVGPEGLEPPTRPLWAASSNQLRYRPTVFILRVSHKKASFYFLIVGVYDYTLQFVSYIYAV